MAYLGVLGSNFGKKTKLCYIAKFGVKTKILKFGTKNIVREFVYFWVSI